MKQKVGENTLGLEGGVSESRGPREGPASEGGTEWREQPASGEEAAAEAGEPHGHGGFKLSGLRFQAYQDSGRKASEARL